MLLPLLRHGRIYESLDAVPVPSVSGPSRAMVSQANAGLIRKDVALAARGRERLRAMPTEEVLERCALAGRRFVEAELPYTGDLDGWVRLTSRSTGLPEAIVRRHGQRLAGLLGNLEAVLRGLMRGLDPRALDYGMTETAGIQLSFVQTARSLGAVLPSNSPGVNGLWLTAPALKLPVMIKPGRADPWTPLRVIQAMISAGLPEEAFGFYPTDHEGADVIAASCERVMVFGGAETVRRHAADPRVEVHGPGFSKIALGPGARWEELLDVIVESVTYNGGRSCINASTVVVERGADALAEALAERLGSIRPLALDDPDAVLASHEPEVAAGLAAALQERLGGARRLTGEVLTEAHGLSWLLPAVVRCEPEHALARTELPFPFVSVVELPADRMAAWLGPTLVCTVLGEDRPWRRTMFDAPNIDRLHLGPVPTTAVRWDQPHEGNLFEATWRRRGFAGPAL